MKRILLVSLALATLTAACANPAAPTRVQEHWCTKTGPNGSAVMYATTQTPCPADAIQLKQPAGR